MRRAGPLSALVVLLCSCQRAPGRAASAPTAARIVKTDAEWRRILTPEQYHVLREKGTETAFTGALLDNHADGRYLCAADGSVLFDSKDKFDSGTGWPSFTRPAGERSVTTQPDNSYLEPATEVLCRTCGGHLGHVFDDGPAPTGKRYCMNSAALTFEPRPK